MFSIIKSPEPIALQNYNDLELSTKFWQSKSIMVAKCYILTFCYKFRIE